MMSSQFQVQLILGFTNSKNAIQILNENAEFLTVFYFSLCISFYQNVYFIYKERNFIQAEHGHITIQTLNVALVNKHTFKF